MTKVVKPNFSNQELSKNISIYFRKDMQLEKPNFNNTPIKEAAEMKYNAKTPVMPNLENKPIKEQYDFIFKNHPSKSTTGALKSGNIISTIYSLIQNSVKPKFQRAADAIEGKIHSIIEKLGFGNDESNKDAEPSLVDYSEEVTTPSEEETTKPNEVEVAHDHGGGEPVTEPTTETTTTPTTTEPTTKETTTLPTTKETTTEPTTKQEEKKTKYSDIPAVPTSNMDPKGELPGATNDEKIWIYCKSQGFTDAQAAAVVGNAQVESINWKYSLRDDDKGNYYGLFQSHHRYAAEYNGKSAKEQLDLMNRDLEGRLNYWNGRGYGTSYSTWQTYSGENDVNAATSAFMYGFEGTMGDQMLDQRQQFAREAYKKFAGKY